MFDRESYKSHYIALINYTLTFVFIIYIGYASIHSLYFSAEPYDEAYYLSESYHFILGGKLFVDFFSIAQIASVFSYPFLKLFLYITNSTDGIILFSRYIYFLFCASVLMLISQVLAFKFTRTLSLALATICVIFVPFNIHGMSYNTLAMLFLTLSLFLNFKALSNNQFNENILTKPLKLYSMLFFSGLFLFFTIAVYPPLAMIFPITLITISIFLNKILKKNAILVYLFGIAIGSFWFLFLFIKVGAQQLITDMQIFLSLGVQGGGRNKLHDILLNCWQQLPNQTLVILCLVSLFLVVYIPKMRGNTHLKLLVVFYLLYLIRSNESLFYIRYLALCSPFVYLAVKEDKIANFLFFTVTIPSLIAGLITSWGSSNGIINSVVGLFPATLSSFCYLIILAFQCIKNRSNCIFFTLMALIILIYPLKISNELYNYDDLPSNQLAEQISQGVFSGIYTTAEKKLYYEKLQSEIKNHTQSAKSILFFDDFPLGYLMTELIPATNTTWTVSPFFYPNYNRKSIIDYYQKKQLMPDIIVQMLHVPIISALSPYSYKYSPTDPIIGLLKLYQPIYKDNNYTIFKKLTKGVSSFQFKPNKQAI